MTTPTYVDADTFLLSRLWRRSVIDHETGCWLWQGAQNGQYGQIRGQDGRHQHVHAAAWRVLNGEPPSGTHLHHRCGVKVCWNPAHIEVLTAAEHRQEHARLVTHCPQGHEYTLENTVFTNGCRGCRECARQRHRVRQRALAGNCVDCGASLSRPEAKRCRNCHLRYARAQRR